MTNLLPDIKIVIADDHEIFRDGLKLTLSKHPEITIAGEAVNGKELLSLVQLHQPDVILTDIKMPVMDGIEATKQILARHADAAIVCLSMFDEDDLIIDMLEAGARGYLLKNSDKQEIIDAITNAYHRQPYYCRSTSTKLAQMIARSTYNPYKTHNNISFTEREKEIICLICESLSNKEIAEKLFLSTRTVEGLRLKIMEKMDVKNTVGLVVYAIKKKIFTIDK